MADKIIDMTLANLDLLEEGDIWRVVDPSGKEGLLDVYILRVYGADDRGEDIPSYHIDQGDIIYCMTCGDDYEFRTLFISPMLLLQKVACSSPDMADLMFNKVITLGMAIREDFYKTLMGEEDL